MIGRVLPAGYFYSPGPMLQRFFNWRLRTPFYYGWLVLAISSVATFAASGLTQVVLGGVQVYITDESGWDDGSLAFAATLGTWLSGMIAPVIGRLADRFGPRWLMPFGLIVAGIAFFVIAGSNSVVMFYGGYVVEHHNRVGRRLWPTAPPMRF